MSRDRKPGKPADEARDPLPFLPRGSALLRRVMLAEILGPPRSQVPWRSPMHARAEPAAYPAKGEA